MSTTEDNLTRLEERLTSLEVAVKKGNADTAEVLNLLRVGKIAATVIRWVSAVAASVAAIYVAMRLKT